MAERQAMWRRRDVGPGDRRSQVSLEFWAGAMARFGTCLVLWWVVERQRRR